MFDIRVTEWGIWMEDVILEPSSVGHLCHRGKFGVGVGTARRDTVCAVYMYTLFVSIFIAMWRLVEFRDKRSHSVVKLFVDVGTCRLQVDPNSHNPRYRRENT